MPVRIVLRGLIGMLVNRDEQKITACLIDGGQALDDAVKSSLDRWEGKPEPHPHFKECMGEHMSHHKHRGEVQVFDGGGQRDEAGLVALGDEENIDIQIDPESKNYVDVAPSYNKFMPKIGRIAENVNLKGSGRLNSKFIAHTVTINRGVVRVRDIGDWDAGSTNIPREFRVDERKNEYKDTRIYQPDAVYQPAKVRFLNASVFGYVATECVVDIEDQNSVTINGPGQIEGKYKGRATASRRVAEDTVEILITNYAPQQKIALPWTLHYRWMFEAAGYNTPIHLGGPELNELAKFGRRYERESWICESEMFLGADGRTGFPFPYRTADMWRARFGELEYANEYETALQPADPWDPVRCPMGDLTPGK